MRLPRVRFTIRSLILVVALEALNLGAIIATPRVNFRRRPWTSSRGLIYADQRREYGVSCTYATPSAETHKTIGARIVSVGRNFEPTVLQVWSRAIASASITLLVLTGSAWDWGTVRRSTTTHTGEVAHGRRARSWLVARLGVMVIALITIAIIGMVFRPIVNDYRAAIVGLILMAVLWDWVPVMPRVWPVVRWVLLVIGLVALNLAGAAFPPAFNVYERTWSNSSPRPPRGFGIRFVGDFSPNPSLTARPIEPPPGTRLELDYCDLFEGLPRVLNLSVDGTLVQRSPMEVALPPPNRLPEVIFQDDPIGEATIEFGEDGRVVGYVGRPGKMMSAPRLLRPPSISFLDMHLPIMSSASFTLLAFVIARSTADDATIPNSGYCHGLDRHKFRRCNRVPR